MRAQRVLSLLAIVVLVTLSACSGRAPSAGEAALKAQQPRSGAQPAAQGAAQTVTQAPAPTGSPTSTAQAAPAPARAPLPPTVVSVKPERGEEQIISAPIIVTFDQPMDPASTSAAFAIEPKAPGEVKVQGNALTFTPTQRLARGEEYRITVASSAKSAGGLPLQRDAAFRFQTAGYLEVTSTQPAHGAAGVAVDSPIVVAFNRPIVPLTGAGEQAALPQPLIITPTIEGKGEWINTSMYRLTPRDGLAASTTYTVTVAAGLTDTGGSILAEPKTFEFRTTDPTILRWMREDSAQVRIDGVISVTFSMPMDKPSTEAAFSLTDETGFKVPGAFNWNTDATELGYKPNEVLKFGSLYRASVGLGAKAANGQGTLRDLPGRQHPIQTVSLPRIARTEPANGNQKYPPDSGIRFGFVSPMNPASFITGTITILPKPTQVYTWYNEFENVLYLDFPKLPATDYTVTLSGKVADPYGNTLGKDEVLKFRTGDLQPILQLNNQGQVGTYSAYTNTQAVIIYRNLSQIQLTLHKAPVEDFVRLTGKDYWQHWDRYVPKQENLVRQWTVSGKAARNKSGVIREPLVDEAGKQLAPGIYVLQLGGALPGDQRPPRQLIVRTDLNVTLKAGTDGALAWATDLKTGQPVAGANVVFTDNEKINVSATTDADGVAEVKLNTQRKTWEQLVAVASGPSGAFGAAGTGWQDGINAWDFGLTGGATAEPYTGYVYTDRPIYRPGQTVYWKAIVRRDNDADYTLPAPGQPVTVTINDDMGNTLTTQSLTLNPLGALDGSLELGPDAGLGYYYVSLRLNEQVGFGTGFQVAEYRKPEYELTAQTDKEEYSQGETIKVTAQANYFFGGPVKNAKVRWVLLANDSSFQYTGEGYWSFQDWDWWETARPGQFGGQVSQGEARTDDEGQVTITAPADITKYKTSQRFTFDITVEDLNNQAVSTQASAVVHLGEFYIGVKPRDYVGQAGQTSQADFITVDSKSRPVPNVKLDVVVSQVEWQSVREKAEDGQFYWVTRPKKTGVVTETLTTDAKGAATLRWTPKAAGEYKIEASARDTKGHTLRSGAYTWVSGQDYVAWRQENNDRIKLVADKDQYNIGDNAEILIPSPYQSPVKALITVERGRVITHEVLELRGNSEILKLPVDARFAPNVYVTVTIMKGIDATTPAPSFKVGMAQLKVSIAEKKLQVIVTPRTGTSRASTSTAPATPLVVAPRANVTWDVQTLDASGKAVSADVSLALVDKAVLTLANNQSGALLDRFYAQRGLGVQTGLTLVYNIDRLVAQLAEDGKGGGGGGGAGGPSSVRTDFPDIAFWRASVQTDAAGKGSVEVTLPDNLTTWVMDARAATETTLVGQSKTEIISTKDLLVRPVLPRFLTVGDKAEIGAVVHNTTSGDLEVTISASAVGLQLAGKTSDKVSIPAGATYKAVWSATTDLSGDTVTVRMTADAATARLSDAVEITLPLLRYTTPEVMGTSGQVETGSDALELVRLPADADPTRGDLTVTVEPSLAAGMVGGLEYLEHYPYECVEQTMSRFLPNVVTYQALKALGVSRPELEQELPRQVAAGLQRIYARQQVDGGWGWWEKDKSNLSVSTYVVFGLAKAQQAGFTVDDNVLQRGITFLRRGLKAPKGLKEHELNQQAFILYALAEAKVAEPNRAGALFDERERLGKYGKAFLALALDKINDSAAPERVETLLSDLEGSAVVTAASAHWEEGQVDLWNMNTDTRTTAIVLLAMTRLDPEQPLGPNTVRWLMSARSADRWQTTQENAWAIMALTEWMAATGELEGNYDWQVRLNNEELGKGSVTPATVQNVTTLRADIRQMLLDQTNGLVISRTNANGQTGKGQLYYTAYLKTYRPVEQIEPVNRGFAVSREYRLADCGKLGPNEQCPLVDSAKVGDIIEVKLTLVAPHSSYYVIVEDPLPAGAEAVDTGLKTTSQAVEGPRMERKGDSEEGYDWWWAPTHVELRDEKAVMFETQLDPGTYEFTYRIRASLPGTFLTLPVTAYQMYFPEVWGRGAGGTFVVTE